MQDLALGSHMARFYSGIMARVAPLCLMRPLVVEAIMQKYVRAEGEPELGFLFAIKDNPNVSAWIGHDGRVEVELRPILGPVRRALLTPNSDYGVQLVCAFLTDAELLAWLLFK